MLQFKQNDTDQVLIMTLSELSVLTSPNYLFVFTHALTRDVVAFVKLNTDDESNYQERYNQFTIDPTVLFAGQQVGEWHYRVYEQASTINLDTAQTGGVLEYGKLILDRAIDFAFTMYDTPTTYKTYNG